MAAICDGWHSAQLRDQSGRNTASGWGIHRGNSQRGKDRGPSGAAKQYLRVRNQPQDGEGSGNHHTLVGVCPGYRGNFLRRRDFLAFAGAASTSAVWRRSWAQTAARLPVIGWLSGANEGGSTVQLGAYRRALQ